MLKKEVRDGNIKGVAMSRGGSSISYLLFTNDNIIFYRASVLECDRVLKVLEDYERVSGQKLNKDKTSLYFSKNTGGHIQDQVKRKFRAEIVRHHEKYLRLPPLVGRGKRKAFN